MTKKKNRFLTFIFSMIPGAAEMYMGFMKMGLTLMLLFFGILMLSVNFELTILVAADVVIWFYSFFHAHNLRSMDDEDFYALEDDYLIHLNEEDKGFWNRLVATRYRNLIALVLILVGISILWDNLIYMMGGMLPHYIIDFLNKIGYRMPQFVLAVGIIIAGVWMIQGKKEELQDDKSKEAAGDGREKDSQNS